MATTALLPFTPPPSSPIFPLSRLPNEVLHIIFEQLTHEDQQLDIAHLRLVCKRFADIGDYYLLSEAHLFFKSSQFQRLRQISQHPIISKKIDTIFYEADVLNDYGSMKEWKNNICVPGWMKSFPSETWPPLPATRREERAYGRSLTKAMQGPKYTHSEKLLRGAYDKYRDYVDDQRSMRLQNYNFEVLKDALMKMPNVKTIELSTEGCLGRSTRMEQVYKDGLSPPLGDLHSEEGCGVGQLRALLLAAEVAGLTFETLAAGNVDWHFFKESRKQNKQVLQKMQRAVRALRTLKLYVTTRSPQDEYMYANDLSHFMVPECAKILHETPHFKNFITATPDLERLDINFDCDEPYPPYTLCDSVGTFTWHSLRVAAFSYMGADEDCLAEFFVRHASTLRKLRLETILLTAGSWPSLLRRARKTLTLEQASLSGRLGSPRELIYFDVPAGLNGGKRAKLEVVVEKYLLEGGEGPLLDLQALFRKYHSKYVYPEEDLPMFVDADSDESIMDRF